MPPKRRQNRPPDPEPPRPTSPSPDRDQSPQDEDDDESFAHAPLPFYNTTFSAHRVSPLYLGSEPLTAIRLQLLAQRLRDRLVGDVVRGVQVGVAGDGRDAIIGRAGALEMVEVSLVSVADVLDLSAEDVETLGGGGEDNEEDTTDLRRLAAQLPGKKALHISLRYELASCTALMLPPLAERGETAAADDNMEWEHSVNPTHFLRLPLLLLRMPAPLKTIIGDFLSTTFDCRVSAMRLGTRSLVCSWEAWIQSAGLPARGPLAKDTVLSLGFHVPPQLGKSSSTAAAPSEEVAATVDHQQTQLSLGLKSIDVIIPAAELKKFVTAGKRLADKQTASPAGSGWGWEEDVKKRRKLAGRLYEEGWEWRTPPKEGVSPEQYPFTEALACYLKEHLGLNLFHPGVRVVKIACGGFVMSETRLKLFAPGRLGEGEGLSLLAHRGAVLGLIGRLLEKALVQSVAV
ncbi:kinetochore complex Sim4 subunit Fta1-domain-containing protein [Chaetomidium leptoderma]|uniref:Kinetochore complex Sim4 subunit Fta1-domain-containing protein n=1 Tax=Chaetomidium leptoderma TaxID=669021 RepID=A0AAN6VDG5_9PEZI|nr:kinetochore complex Sim4 subunit Fta1-domain-containing protein [Chaetomidium leptoderma]